MKEELPEGPWQQEPDRVEWVDRKTGYDCLVLRGPVGALCGYVGVPEGHPMYGAHYDTVDVDVHGGLTYSNKCDGSHICHLVGEGAPEVWWLGFDCGHSFDLMPAMIKHFSKDSIVLREGRYRDMKYVMDQVSGLAEQLDAPR